MFLLLPKELVPFVIVTKRQLSESSRTLVRGQAQDTTGLGSRDCHGEQQLSSDDVLGGLEDDGTEMDADDRGGVLEAQLLEEPPVLAGLVPLLKLLPHHVASLLLLLGILQQ